MSTLVKEGTLGGIPCGRLASLVETFFTLCELIKADVSSDERSESRAFRV